MQGCSGMFRIRGHSGVVQCLTPPSPSPQGDGLGQLGTDQALGKTSDCPMSRNSGRCSSNSNRVTDIPSESGLWQTSRLSHDMCQCWVFSDCGLAEGGLMSHCWGCCGRQCCCRNGSGGTNPSNNSSRPAFGWAGRSAPLGLSTLGVIPQGPWRQQ